MEKLSRRDFLKGAAVAGASAAAVGLVSCKIAEGDEDEFIPVHEIVWDKECDVLVVGGGASGITCATVVAEAGKSVIIIDRNTNFGGCALLASGSVGWRGPIKSRKDQWQDFTADDAYAVLTDINVRENKKNDPALVRAHVDNTAETYEFLLARGVDFREASGAMPQVYAREYEPDPGPGQNAFPLGPDVGSCSGSGIIRPTANAAIAAGAELLENHELTRLIVDDNGKVIGGEVIITESTDFGVQPKAGEKPLFFKANTAVMLGSGSWKGNTVLRRLMDPRIPDDMRHTGQPYAYITGTGIVAAMKIGAAMCSDQSADSALWRIKFGTPWGLFRLDSGIAAPGLSPNANSHCMHYIWVNKSGERYFDESNPLSGPASVDPAFLQEDMMVWMVFDEDGREACKFDIEEPNCDKDYVFKADTIDELAKLIDVPVAALSATVDRYNGFVDAGEDSDFGKPADKLTAKIQTGPFYAVRVLFMLHDTTGGLWVNQNMQVKDIEGNVIYGLYAGGESAGGLNIAGLSRALTQGYIAGNSIISL